ncbi:hypothetical protein, partial [Listeria immobilis]|uniref:hypothetical protein n=1 Tax=Listeria immobilis TaxID=2713502 RepID=UPI001C9C1ACB
LLLYPFFFIPFCSFLEKNATYENLISGVFGIRLKTRSFKKIVAQFDPSNSQIPSPLVLID